MKRFFTRIADNPRLRDVGSAMVVGVAAGFVIFALADMQPERPQRPPRSPRFARGKSVDPSAVRQAIDNGEYADLARWAVGQYLSHGEQFVQEVRNASASNETAALVMPDFDRAALQASFERSR